MSIEVIMDSVRNLQLGQGMTVERLQVGLQQLVSDSAGYVSRIGEQGGLAEGSQWKALCCSDMDRNAAASSGFWG